MMRLPKVSRAYFTLNLKLHIIIFQSFGVNLSWVFTKVFTKDTSVFCMLWWVWKQFCEYDTRFDIAQACCALTVPNAALNKKLHWPSMIKDLEHITHSRSQRSSHLTSLGQNYQHIWLCTLSHVALKNVHNFVTFCMESLPYHINKKSLRPSFIYFREEKDNIQILPN